MRSGWLTVTGWIAGLTATAFFVSTLIQALVVQNNSNYQPLGWHGTLLFWAVLLLCVAINTVLSSALPVIEILILIFHLLGFLAIMIPLVYLAPQHNSASSVFKTFLNEGGWSTQALSFFIGLNGNAVAFVGRCSGCVRKYQANEFARNRRRRPCKSTHNATVPVLTFPDVRGSEECLE